MSAHRIIPQGSPDLLNPSTATTHWFLSQLLERIRELSSIPSQNDQLVFVRKEIRYLPLAVHYIRKNNCGIWICCSLLWQITFSSWRAECWAQCKGERPPRWHRYFLLQTCPFKSICIWYFLRLLLRITEVISDRRWKEEFKSFYAPERIPWDFEAYKTPPESISLRNEWTWAVVSWAGLINN